MEECRGKHFKNSVTRSLPWGYSVYQYLCTYVYVTDIRTNLEEGILAQDTLTSSLHFTKKYYELIYKYFSLFPAVFEIIKKMQ